MNLIPINQETAPSPNISIGIAPSPSPSPFITLRPPSNLNNKRHSKLRKLQQMVKAELIRDINAILRRMQVVVRDLEAGLAADGDGVPKFVP